jgi:hypothetical protein
VRVQHRHIIYVQGYDPRGLAQYYRMFRTELRKFGALYQLATTMSRPKSSPDGETASWTIDTSGPDWQTRTSYDFLRWEDLIQPDLTWPIWRTLVYGISVFWRLIFSGTFGGFWRAHWRFATFVFYPHFVLLLEALGAVLMALVLGMILDAFRIPSGLIAAAGVAIFVAVLGTLLKYTEKYTYLLYLMSDHVFTMQFAHRKRPQWDARIDRFAQHLVDTVRTSDAQEIVIVGHSSGSFLGVEILARALDIDPDLGRRKPRVVLLTIGGNLPVVGFHAASRLFREHLRRLAIEPSIDWIDCQSRKDVMNFYPFDPITGHGIDAGPARRNPTIVPIRFREIVRSDYYNRFRWQFFRVHFQFVMANERPHAYDFFMIVCGPVPLKERMTDPTAALGVAVGDTATRNQAWKVLESGPNRAFDDADLGKLEPTARRSG